MDYIFFNIFYKMKIIYFKEKKYFLYRYGGWILNINFIKYNIKLILGFMFEFLYLSKCNDLYLYIEFCILEFFYKSVYVL